MASKAYTLTTSKSGERFIVIDDSVKRTPAESEEIQMYVVAGYVIRHKSKARSEAAKGRSDNITADQIRQELANDKPALQEFERIVKASGFFSAKKFYKTWKLEQAEKPENSGSGMTAAELPDKPARKKPGRKPKAAIAEGSEAEAAEGLSESEG